MKTLWRGVSIVLLVAIFLGPTVGTANAATKKTAHAKSTAKPKAPPSLAAIKKDVLAKQPGCWANGGNNLEGAYETFDYFVGAHPIAPSGDPGTGSCAGGTDNEATVNVAVYHSPTAALLGAKAQSAGTDYALFQAGDVAVSIYQSATPTTIRIIEKIPGLTRIAGN